MALTRVYGRVVYPHGSDTPTPVTGDGVIEYVHATPGIIDGAVHGPDRKRIGYVAGVAEDAWLKPGMWRAYVYPDEGRSYTLHLGVPEGGETTIADAVGEIVPEGIITKGEQGPAGASVTGGRDNGDGTVSFELSDGTFTDPVTVPPGPRGEQGPEGPQGPKGDKGDPGEGGGGIREVEGDVQLPADGPRVLELYTVGDTAIGPETFAVDTAVVARRRADGVWERWVVGSDSGWREFGAATPEPPRSVTPEAPEFVDRSGTAQDVTIIPAVSGVQYLIDGVPVASGSHPSSGTVTVDAIAADESVTIVGTASWTHEFSTGVVQEWGTRAHRATFTRADTASTGIYHDPTRPTEFPPVYTDESGGVWNGSSYNTHIRSAALQFTANNVHASVEHGQPGDVSVRATVKNGASGRIYAQVNGPIENSSVRGICMTFQGATMSLYDVVDSTSYNKDGGTGTVALIPDYDVATPYRLRLDVVGDQAMLFVDDVHYMTGTIRSSRITEAGGRRFCGLAALTAGVVVDDVEVWVP